MSDNTQLPNGPLVAGDDIDGVLYQRVKLTLGGDGVNDGDVSAANPMPVQGAFYPATQPVSVAALPLPTGATTEATLSALKAAIDALSAKIAACNTGSVTLDAGTLAALETITISNPTPQGLTDAQLRASALSVTVSNPTAQGLTDGQLRAAAVPVTVSNPTATGLTDAQLRATAVPVSLASVAVSNFPATVSVDNFPVGGTGLTDAELRATALPLPTGAATETTLLEIAEAVRATDTPYTLGDMGVFMLGKRRDEDSTLVEDGSYSGLNVDEVGRLKVATQPGTIAPKVQAITANTQTVWMDVARASNITISMVAASLVGHNVTFEYSNNSTTGTDGNWYVIQVVRSNANTVETASGVLAATPVYGWEASVNAYKWFRVRTTAHTSGTATYTLLPGSYATEPIPAVQVTGTQGVSGTVTATVTPPAPATPYFVHSAATTNGALILTGTSSVHSLWATNEGASPAYIKLYNKATAPTVGTDVPEMTIPIPAAASGVPGVANPNMGFIPFRFALGLGIAITRNAVYTDTTAIGAGEVKVKLSRAI